MSAVIIDGSNALLGRLASFAAKQAIAGKEVVVLNCNNVVISGSRRTTINTFQTMRKRGGAAQRGPLHSRMPERIVKRAIRGMLPYQQLRGMSAYKRVMCYNETPVEYADKPVIKSGKEKKIKTMTLKELSKEL